MLIRIDGESPRPIFEQVASSVRADIAAGVVRVGDRLPPARDVADALDINVHTVLHAYRLLRDEGLVDLRRGRGAVVSPAAAALGELRDDIRSLIARAETLGVPAPALAALIEDPALRGGER
ncbi:GntR family transcriptional regulator [Microbacterium sp.]|uniref:GntR family transcriptional regulator n=1 Tax=Microbacterium sp. TaxID=51671 RepID=UPI0039E69064